MSQIQNSSSNSNKPKRNFRMIVIFAGIAAISALVIGVLIFVALHLPANASGYEAFFTAVGAIGTLITGIALSIFAYYQWRISDRQHKLLYSPELVISGRGSPRVGPGKDNGMEYPFRIEWVVLINNTSQLPIVVEHMGIELTFAGQDSYKRAPLTPLYCHMAEPRELTPPFQITLNSPQTIKWIVQGPNAGDPFDYVSVDDNSRDFRLVFTIFYNIPPIPETKVEGYVSGQFHVVKNAPWGTAKRIFIKISK